MNKQLVKLIVAPFLGLLFCLFLPLIGVVMIAGMLMQKAYKFTQNALMQYASFGWHPCESYLSGKKHKEIKKDE